MAIRIGGQDPGDLGPPFRKRQIRNNSGQGFRNAAPYDSRTGNDSPLWPTVKIKIAVADEDIPPGESGVVVVWRNPIKGSEPKHTNERLRVYNDWLHNEVTIKEGDQVVCFEFEDEKLWRVFVGSGKAGSVELQRCSDGTKIAAYDVFLNDDLGNLSDNVGKVIRLRESSLFRSDCWLILRESECIPEICPSVATIENNCSECLGCYLLTQCVDPSITKIVMANDMMGGSFPFEVVLVTGGVVGLDDDLCYTVEKSPTCDGAEEVNVVWLAPNCEACEECFELTPCWGEDKIPIYIYKDGHELELGDVIKLYGICYEVTDDSFCGPDAYHLGSSYQEQEDCEACRCYFFDSCSEGLYDSITVKSATDDEGTEVDLDTLIGLTVMTPEGNCYVVSETLDGCPNAVDVVILESFEDCPTCRVWRLDPCNPALPEVWTYSDMGDWGAGYVIRRAEDGICYTIIDETISGVEVVETTVEEAWGRNRCAECLDRLYCLLPVCNDCYQNIGEPVNSEGTHDCEREGDEPEKKITDEDLAHAVGQYIRWPSDVDDTDCEGPNADQDKCCPKCYLVEVYTGSDPVNLPAPLDYDGPFPDCFTCQKQCLWVVTDVYIYEEGSVTQIRQKKKKIIVDSVCECKDELIIDIEDCEDLV